MNPSVPVMQARAALPRAALPVRVLIFISKLLAFFLALHFLVFCLFDLLPSADFLQTGWAGADPTLLARTRERLGLNGNWIHRYFGSLGNLVQGDLGRSVVGGYSVGDLFFSRVWNSLPQWVGALTMCVCAIPLGMIFCSRRIGIPQRLWLFMSHVFLVPQFLAAMVLFALYISVISPWIPQDLDRISRLLFAVLSAGLLPAGMLFIAAANSARSYSQEPFVVTYLAMGMNWTQIRWRCLRNVTSALRPLMGRILLAVATGTLFAELTFSINGMGKLFVDSLRNSDWPTMQAWVLFIGAVTLTVSVAERKAV
jgi:peptide/nickel transport system permease protein